jgi:hypothetical protein
MSRRCWLRGALGCLAARPSRNLVGAVDEAESREVAAVKAQGRAAGLGPFEITRTEYYLGVGDAPERYRAEALVLCEAVARDCTDHFRNAGFDVAMPAQRLVVVLLADAEAFARYLGVDRDRAVGGIYELETNHLVCFDLRKSSDPNPRAARGNTIALVHEATHQWSFNAGLLDRQADVPVCVTEGIAMYAEERPPRGRARPGGINQGRVEGLRVALRAGAAWIPLTKLLVDDRLAGGETDPVTQQLVYALDWLLVHTLMQPSRRVAFRGYLERLRHRREPSRRLADAEEMLGDLESLEGELRRLATRLGRSRL